MLFLTRRAGESIIVRDDVVITVIDVHGKKVRLGIEAPRDVEVHRNEVFERIRRTGERNPDLLEIQ